MKQPSSPMSRSDAAPSVTCARCGRETRDYRQLSFDGAIRFNLLLCAMPCYGVAHAVLTSSGVPTSDQRAYLARLKENHFHPGAASYAPFTLEAVHVPALVGAAR